MHVLIFLFTLVCFHFYMNFKCIRYTILLIIIHYYRKKSIFNKINSPMRELISSVMVSSPLLLTFGTLSLLLYFRLPLTFLPSKGRSITTLGTRWHDFFIFLLLSLDILQLFYSLHYTSFPFLKGCRLEKGHIVPVLCSHS